MTNEIMIAGFGGQGVMAIGKTLAEAGMKEGKDVSWLPSYGPEMRGGTANCCVVISEDEIVCPIVLEPTELIAMNLPSLRKFEKDVVKGGTIFVNSSIINESVLRDDVRVINVPCLDIANELGNARVANMAMLGAFIGATEMFDAETLVEALRHKLGPAKEKLIPLNRQAIENGMAAGRA